MKRKHGWRLIRQVVCVSPGLFFLEYLTSALYGILLALTPAFMESAFEDAAAFASGALPWSAMLKSLGSLFAILVFSEIFAGLSDFLGETYSDLTAQKIFSGINRRIAGLPALSFEQPETLNTIQKSYAGAFYSRSMLHVAMDFLTLYLPYFLVYGVYLYKSSPVLPFALAGIFLPMLLAQRRKETLYASQADTAAPLQRRKETFLSYILSPSHAKEARTLGAVGFFLNKITGVQKEINHALYTHDRKLRRVDILSILVNLLGYFCVILLLLHLVKTGEIQLAAFVAVFASLRTAYDQLKEVFHDRAAEFSEAAANAKNYLAFLDMQEPPLEAAQSQPIQSIQAENLSFTYPDGTAALQGLRFAARTGDCIAVVGENGSGKTTLAKLLAGVYPPTGGSLCINETGASPSRRNGRISQCFQQFCRYQLTLRANVQISQPEKPAADVTACLSQAQFPLDGEKFPQGLDTLLGKPFGGEELSGGQWQKLALARAMYRERDLLILDEPTASIDPLYESSLYQTFRDCCTGKIGFIITHRLGIVKICSAVLVLKDGKQLDFGTHEELLSRCPYYRTLWQAQADMYV